MMDAVEAAAVLLPQAQALHRPKATDHRFKVRFRVLPDEEALARLPRSSGPAFALPDPENGAVYAPNAHGSGLDVCGELGTLRGRPLRRGDIVKMEIRLGRTRARIRCLGMVAWVRVNKLAGLFQAGVGFVAVDRRDLNQD